ncbi:MAG: hypothetical protein EWM72_03193 [Nitrospira sp.]|nr:MAG: hypothetical protein EWM72_03193 [Nitrospira sp.]
MARPEVVLILALSGGQGKKLALTVCMRRLLTILNAMLKNGVP